jgi:hypothetical protein
MELWNGFYVFQFCLMLYWSSLVWF